MSDHIILDFAKQLHDQYSSVKSDKMNYYISALERAIKTAEAEFEDELFVESQQENIKKDSMIAPACDTMLKKVDYSYLIKLSLLFYLKSKAQQSQQTMIHSK
jgi:hypothetical protein